VVREIQKLKNRKVSRTDKITNKEIKYANLTKEIVLLFNKIIEEEKISQDLKKSEITNIQERRQKQSDQLQKNIAIKNSKKTVEAIHRDNHRNIM